MAGGWLAALPFVELTLGGVERLGEALFEPASFYGTTDVRGSPSACGWISEARCIVWVGMGSAYRRGRNGRDSTIIRRDAMRWPVKMALATGVGRVTLAACGSAE